MSRDFLAAGTAHGCAEIRGGRYGTTRARARLTGRKEIGRKTEDGTESETETETETHLLLRNKKFVLCTL
jgi:hypothetical protein